MGTPSPTTENVLVGMEVWLMREVMRFPSPTPQIPAPTLALTNKVSLAEVAAYWGK